MAKGKKRTVPRHEIDVCDDKGEANISIADANITGVAGSKVSGNISGLAAGFTGNLAGDVTGCQIIVPKIGG